MVCVHHLSLLCNLCKFACWMGSWTADDSAPLLVVPAAARSASGHRERCRRVILAILLAVPRGSRDFLGRYTSGCSNWLAVRNAKSCKRWLRLEKQVVV